MGGWIFFQRAERSDGRDRDWKLACSEITSSLKMRKIKEIRKIQVMQIIVPILSRSLISPLMLTQWLFSLINTNYLMYLCRMRQTRRSLCHSTSHEGLPAKISRNREETQT